MLRKAYYIPRMLQCSVMQYRTPTAPFAEHSLDGKIAIVTGGNSGIGFETTKSLALQGCEVYILCRNPTKAQDAVSKINQSCQAAQSKGSCTALSLDLADLESVKKCIQEIRSKFQDRKIDFFFCNGGIMSQPYSKTPQGYEIHFATNHLGHFALVGGIIDLLTKSAAKIIVLTGDIAVWETDASHDYFYSGDGTDAYCRSKICNQSFVRELHKRYGDNGLSVYCVHPGVVDSNLFSLEEGFLHRIELLIRPFIMIDCEKGAQSSLLCALTNEDEVVPKGSYFHNVYGVCDYHDTAANQEWSGKIWNLSMKLCADNGVEIKY
jgi:NAD(P)-dependent dehydrogenase (short-subunit alcohol dehydrogenase family)